MSISDYILTQCYRPSWILRISNETAWRRHIYPTQIGSQHAAFCLSMFYFKMNKLSFTKPIREEIDNIAYKPKD